MTYHPTRSPQCWHTQEYAECGGGKKKKNPKGKPAKCRTDEDTIRQDDIDVDGEV
jgi:hypothetical protein